jgi:hypothetical protein
MEKTMIFEVEMLAFGKPGEVRKVNVPDEALTRAKEDTDNILEAAFYYGQNDFQPQNHPSVSAGDVIRWKEENYLVAGMGFKKLTDEQLNDYRSLDQNDKFIGRCQIEIGEPVVGRRNK